MLGGFLESDLSLEAHRRLHRLKPEKKDLNPSPFDQKGRPLNQKIGLNCRSSRRCEVELELSLSFTPATIKMCIVDGFSETFK